MNQNIMIDEKIIILIPGEDHTKHRLGKYIEDYLIVNADIENNFKIPLRRIFRKVIHYDFLKRMLEIGIKGTNEEIIELVKKEHPKYVAWFGMMYEFTGSTFDAIRQEGSKVVGFFGDDEYRFSLWSKWWIPHLDYCVTFSNGAGPRYEALGARVIETLACEGIPVERDWSNIVENYEVTFVGIKSKPLREYYINHLRKNNIPVQAFGREWGSGFISFNEMIKVYKTSKINLNFSRSSYELGLKGRLSTICMAGGFLLNEYAPNIEKYFNLDNEIVCFKDAEELVAKVNYYLDHDEERRAIAQAGWKRAVSEYTPFHMFSRIFEKLERDIAAGIKGQPQLLKMPIWVRSHSSEYYFRWGRAFLEEGYGDLWRDALAIAVSFNPLNISAWYYLGIGHLPPTIHKLFFLLYKPFKALGELYGRTRLELFQIVDMVPYLKDLKRLVAQRLHYR